ncbi:SseB family protein [Micromonospora sp. DT31]|uniref:SseB family protein n=1 Tax=Micromonospora sp. DT31 TaxID=3393434 RepID=UPI003CF7BC9C
MTGWEPATEAEVAMWDALRAQDQQRYFHVLTRVDLLLPVTGGSPDGWGTWTSGGRTHVLAFTSATALRASMGEHAGATRRVPYPDLAGGWPDPEWWLAVNPGLPIEGYLPAWYVSQLSRGEVRLPGRTMGARARLERVEAAARNGVPDRPPPAVPGMPLPPPPVPPSAVPPLAVPPPAVPPPAVPPARGGRAADGDEPATVPSRTGSLLGRRLPTTPPRRRDRQTGDPGRAADADALDGWLTDLRRRPDEPDPFAAAGSAPTDESTPVPPAPARSFFEPSSGRSPRRASPLDDPHRPADRAALPSRFAGGQPFPRRRPLNEPVREDPTRAFPAEVPAPAPAPRPDEPATTFRPTRPEDTAGTLPRRHTAPAAPPPVVPAPAVPAPEAWTSPADAADPDASRWAGLDDTAVVEAPAVAEPVSAPPLPRRDFTPIVIEGTVIEARDLTEPPATEPPASVDQAAPVPVGPPQTSWGYGADPIIADSAATRPLDTAPPPDERATRFGEPTVPLGSRFEPTVPLSPGPEPAVSMFEPAEEASAPPRSDVEPTISLFEPASPPVEPTVPLGSPVEPTVPLFAPSLTADEETVPLAPDTAPTMSLFEPTASRSQSAESTVSLFEPTTQPESERTTRFASGEPTAPLPEPMPTASEPTPTASLPAPEPRPVAPEPAPVDPAPSTPVEEAEFVPANEVEEELLAAAGSGRTDGFLTTLLLARVLLPVSADSIPGSRLGDPGFVWRTEPVDGQPCVSVYTSTQRLAEHAPGPVETVRVKFVQLIRRWPDVNWSFQVNPGSPVGATYPGEQVLALANWAAEVGLGDDVEPEPAPAAPEPAAGSRPAAPVGGNRPVAMQKAIPASQLSYYLERGYDRVSGFVHRAGELAHLRTPAQLFDALGLGHPGSPFSRDAEEIYLLRWPAYRPSLYRIPYGGQNESAMRAMEGWVIERPPFRGNGFAPGESSDVIAEFKVDSARLPHGAELWRVGADGGTRLVAVLDTDALLWRKADEA